LYNGSGGAVYSTTTVPTSTSLPDGNGIQYSVYEYASNGIQNGNPDGMALAFPNGTLVEFLSYGGTFTAVGGPAGGKTPLNIGVQESGSTPVGFSLQLINGVAK
jgi:hypothetical protein